ncbi:hypothetical protein NA56DRAFT_711057 [Hyaloscypha hepaticicola]|uniref:Fe-S cluster assembly protein Dre2 N-terminal domain-containing protein n=1 Tax=Hyaloscypha hepaticicola TaxID=2082293 RepID=A0A2J6PJN0_9HELO|nr:hypothetical protein NA56DRAFT_711057 [Hyaloscypha hepaticicola]
METMAKSAILDGSTQRTLHLAPPSVTAKTRYETSSELSIADLQMLDQLSTGFVLLPPNTYDYILMLTDTNDGPLSESLGLIEMVALSTGARGGLNRPS